jgi:hypothetical protein
MAEITLFCLANQEKPVVLFLLPYQFAAKYYPWALMGLLNIMNSNIQFDLICGILFGYYVSITLEIICVSAMIL